MSTLTDQWTRVSLICPDEFNFIRSLLPSACSRIRSLVLLPLRHGDNHGTMIGYFWGCYFMGLWKSTVFFFMGYMKSSHTIWYLNLEIGSIPPTFIAIKQSIVGRAQYLTLASNYAMKTRNGRNEMNFYLIYKYNYTVYVYLFIYNILYLALLKWM